MTTKERLPLHKRAYPYFLLILGLLFGLGIATDWDLKLTSNWSWDVSLKTQLETEKSAWDIISCLGTLLGGIATISLAFIASSTAHDWRKGIVLTKKIERLFSQKDQILKRMDEHDRKINEVFLFNWSTGYDSDSFPNYEPSTVMDPKTKKELSNSLFLYGSLIASDASRITKLIEYLLYDLMREDIEDEVMTNLKKAQKDINSALSEINLEIRNSFSGDEIKTFNKENLKLLFRKINSYHESKSIFLSNVSRAIETLK